MRLCIADPPYLGRANRWYGSGCGHGKGQGKADYHPNAQLWDRPETHQELVRELERDFDGWAIAMSVHSLSTYLSVVETDSRNGIRVLSWIKPKAVPSGSRIKTSWEPVLVRIPKERKGYDIGVKTNDYLIADVENKGFIGAKPEAWTHWLLDVLGYQQGDEVVDKFRGSNSVEVAIASYALRHARD